MKMKRLAVIAATCATTALTAIAAHAAPVLTAVGADLSAADYTFTYAGGSFTFGFNGDYFGGGPLTISTAGGGEVNTVFGAPSTNFVDRGTVTFGPGMQYAAFPTPTPIRFTNGDNFIGLRTVEDDGDAFYGFAYTTNNILNGFGFETTPNTAITATTIMPTSSVPESATWAMMIGGFGLVGLAMRRRQASPRVTFG